jgi:hypothetical protein
VKTTAHIARGNNPQARGMLQTADVAKPRANETENSCRNKLSGMPHSFTPLTRWNRILRKILIEKIITFK